MSRTHALLLAPILTLLVCATSEAQLMLPHVADDLGLTQAWARRVPGLNGAQSIVDQQLFVHEKTPDEYVEIVTAAKPAAEGETPNEPTVLMRISTTRLGASGQAIGMDEATRLANNEIRRLKRRGIEATVSTRKVPRVRLYTLADDGTLENRDAESGDPIWSVNVGDRRLPYFSLGVGEKQLTVINGGNLILVDAITGEASEPIRTRKAPLFGAVNTGDYAMVPTYGSGIQGYRLSDPKFRPFLEIVAGNPLALPTKSPESTRVAWGTDRGYVYVMELQGTPSVLFRLNTDGIVNGRVAAASGDRFFFGSEAGQVYGLRATKTGRVLWSQPFGEPFYHEPIIIEDKLLIRSTFGNLYALSLENGSRQWEQSAPNIGELIGSFNDQIFLTDSSGSLGVLDLKTGARIANFNQIRPASYLVNKVTDRLYLVGDDAIVQCLRPVDEVLPNFNTQPDVEEKVEEAPATPQQDSTPFGADPGMDDDPFGAGGADDDPFGGGGDNMDDPFGGGGEDMDDPFGGDNPFG